MSRIPPLQYQAPAILAFTSTDTISVDRCLEWDLIAAGFQGFAIHWGGILSQGLLDTEEATGLQ